MCTVCACLLVFFTNAALVKFYFKVKDLGELMLLYISKTINIHKIN